MLSQQQMEEHMKIRQDLCDSGNYGEFCRVIDEIIGNSIIKQQQLQRYTKEHYNKPKVKRYSYFITFTQDPKKKHFNKVDYIEKRILKLLRGKQAHAKYCAYVREGGDKEDKHIHWHVLLESTTFVKKYDIIRNYTKEIGNVKFETKFCYDYTKTLNYISKQCSFKILFDGVFEDYLTKNPTTMRCDKYKELSVMPHVDFPLAPNG